MNTKALLGATGAPSSQIRNTDMLLGTVTALSTTISVTLDGTSTAIRANIGLNNADRIKSGSRVVGVMLGRQFYITDVLTGVMGVAFNADSNSAQSVNSATFTTVSGWTTFSSSIPNDYISAQSAGTFTIGTEGTYSVMAQATWATAANNLRRITAIFVNGTEVARQDVGNSGSNAGPNVSAHLNLAAGDALTVQVFQNNGAALALAGSQIKLHMVRLGTTKTY